MVRILPAGRLVYGMQLPVQSLSILYAEPWEADAGPEELARIARAADRLGFHYLATCDHVAVPRRLAGAMGTTWYDPVATLGWLAGITERVLLVSHVAVAVLRHPLVTAKSCATLDRLSGGRLVVGVGAGHVKEEFDALGVDFAGRGRLLDEVIDALDVALREEFPQHQGERFSFRDLGQRPRPVRLPRPPIWVGGSSPAAVRRAALKGDGWLPQGDPRGALAGQIERLLRLREAAGIEEPPDIGAIAEPLYVGDPAWRVGRRTLSGKPERLAESLREYRDMGVGQIQVRFRSRACGELLEQMEAFATEVAPHLNE